MRTCDVVHRLHHLLFRLLVIREALPSVCSLWLRAEVAFQDFGGQLQFPTGQVVRQEVFKCINDPFLDPLLTQVRLVDREGQTFFLVPACRLCCCHSMLLLSGSVSAAASPSWFFFFLVVKFVVLVVVATTTD